MVTESLDVDQASRSTCNKAYLFWWPKTLPLTRSTEVGLHSTGSLTCSPLAPVTTSWAPPSYIGLPETSSFYSPCFWPTSACLLVRAKAASEIWSNGGECVEAGYQFFFPRHWQLGQRPQWIKREELFSPVTILNRQQETSMLLSHLWHCVAS